jgi:hypothetical protein
VKSKGLWTDNIARKAEIGSAEDFSQEGYWNKGTKNLRKIGHEHGIGRELCPVEGFCIHGVELSGFTTTEVYLSQMLF